MDASSAIVWQDGLDGREPPFGASVEAYFADADPPNVLEAACRRAIAGSHTQVTIRWQATIYHVSTWPHADGAELLAIAGTEPLVLGLAGSDLSRLLNQIDGMLYRCRVDESWTMELVSDGCLAITGYAPAQLRLNREVAFGDLVHPDDREWLWEKCNVNLRDRRSCSNQYRIRHADGSWRWIWDRAHGVYDERGDMVFVEGLVTDVTFERSQQAERERLEEHMRHSQRIESLGLLAGGVAHDFNNLLQVILGHAQLARVESGDGVREDLDAITTAATRAAALTRQLLTFGRRQPLQLAVTDLNVEIEAQLAMLRRLLPESITIDFIPGHKLPLVDIDVVQIHQVITNLCLNARDAMRSNGRITVETETVLVNGEYRQAHPWARPGRYVLCSVIDTGIGIEPDVLPHIFEPFFTTKKPDEGSGLGLAMVYGIVRSHEGMVHVYSEPGIGTTFKIYLPASARPASDIGTKLEGAVPAGRRERVLVVEDEPAVRKLVSRILEAAGYEVIVAADGNAAIAIVETERPIDLVLVDAVMPGISGLETVERITRLQPGLKVIVTTGHSRDLVRRDGTRDLLLKPYAPDDLVRMVRRVLDGK